MRSWTAKLKPMISRIRAAALVIAVLLSGSLGPAAGADGFFLSEDAAPVRLPKKTASKPVPRSKVPRSAKLQPVKPVERPAAAIAADALADDEDDDSGSEAAVTAPAQSNGGCAACTVKGVRAGGNETAAKIKAEAVKSASKPSRRFNGDADRLSQAAWSAAAKCRDFAQFKKKRLHLSLRKRYNSCAILGSMNPYKSKGMCAAGVREALSEAGIRVPPADARNMRAGLKRAGLVQTAYSPYTVPKGTVLVCNGGRSGFGHTEIVVMMHGKRQFCSDFCSAAPTCGKRGYYNATAFKFPGT